MFAKRSLKETEARAWFCCRSRRTTQASDVNLKMANEQLVECRRVRTRMFFASFTIWIPDKE
jgi:hypothetical protein